MAIHSRDACKRLQRTPTAITSYTEFVPPGVTLEDAQSASYWVNVSGSFRLNDIVNLVAMDGSFDAVLRIVRLGPGFIDFRTLSVWRPEIEEPGSGRFELGWAGPKGKWFIRNTVTDKKVAENLDKPAAKEELQRLDGLKEAA